MYIAFSFIGLRASLGARVVPARAPEEMFCYFRAGFITTVAAGSFRPTGALIGGQRVPHLAHNSGNSASRMRGP
jgi:hypothetical protein